MYYVFAYITDRPEGGASDLHVVKATLKEAIKYIETRLADPIHLDYYHVMNKSGKIVYTAKSNLI